LKVQQHMQQVRRRRSTLQISIALLIIHLGYAERIQALPQLPQPPSKELRAHLGTIGVVSVQFAPEVKMLTPAKGWASGAAKGAVQTEGKLMNATSAGRELGVICCVVLTPFALCGGALSGAAKAPPAAEVKEMQEELNKDIPANIEIQEKMRAQFLQVAREETYYAIVLLEDRGPLAPDEKLSYDSLAGHDIDTVLEIGVLNFGLKGNWMEINPPLTFFMTLRTRLIRIAGGEVVYAATLRYESVTNHTFDVWAANDAQLLKEEFSPCYASLAEKIVEEVFLLYLP
jgi:hypothetical protein